MEKIKINAKDAILSNKPHINMKHSNHHPLHVSILSSLAILLIAMTSSLFLTGCAGSVGTPPELSGHLLVVGSTALQPLATAAATLYHRQHPEVQIEVQGGGSLVGLDAVTNQKSGIGDSDIYADPAVYPDPNLTDHIVCVIPFTMVTGPGVTVTSLTPQQIIDIFSTGKIKNWQQVGGSNLPIVPVVRPGTSGTPSRYRDHTPRPLCCR